MQCLGAEMEKTKIASHQCAHVQGTLSSEDAGASKGPCRNQGGETLDGWRETPRRKHVLTQTTPFPLVGVIGCVSLPCSEVFCPQKCTGKANEVVWVADLRVETEQRELQASQGRAQPQTGIFLDGISVS